MKIIVIIPTYNEANNIEPLVKRVFEELPNATIMVVDDNSPDGTSLRVQTLIDKNPNIILLSREKKEGLGKAYIHAFNEVLKDGRFSHVITMDADYSHDPIYFKPMISATDSGATFIIGSRYIVGGGTEGWELWRKTLSVGGNFYARTITGMPIHDVTAGFNLIATDILRKLDFGTFGSSGYAFQMELKSVAYGVGAKFAEVPILFRNRREGESKISKHIIREGIVAPWKIRLRKK